MSEYNRGLYTKPVGFLNEEFPEFSLFEEFQDYFSSLEIIEE